MTNLPPPFPLWGRYPYGGVTTHPSGTRVERDHLRFVRSSVANIWCATMEFLFSAPLFEKFRRCCETRCRQSEPHLGECGRLRLLGDTCVQGCARGAPHYTADGSARRRAPCQTNFLLSVFTFPGASSPLCGLPFYLRSALNGRGRPFD